MLDGSCGSASSAADEEWATAEADVPFDFGGVYDWGTSSIGSAGTEVLVLDPGICPGSLTIGNEAYLGPSGHPLSVCGPGTSS